MESNDFPLKFILSDKNNLLSLYLVISYDSRPSLSSYDLKLQGTDKLVIKDSHGFEDLKQIRFAIYTSATYFGEITTRFSRIKQSKRTVGLPKLKEIDIYDYSSFLNFKISVPRRVLKKKHTTVGLDRVTDNIIQAAMFSKKKVQKNLRSQIKEYVKRQKVAVKKKEEFFEIKHQETIDRINFVAEQKERNELIIDKCLREGMKIVRKRELSCAIQFILMCQNLRNHVRVNIIIIL